MKTTMLSMLAATATATAVFAGGALAQTDGTFLLLSTNTVSPSSPMTTIEVWTTWVGPDHLFSAVDYDLTAGDGAFSNPVNVLQGVGSTTGVIAGNVVLGARNGQLHIPNIHFGSSDNPILLATYDWTTTEFTPRTVSLDTSNTTRFILAVIETGATIDLFPQEFTPGAGVINVVPGPAAWFVVVAPLAAGIRRRRR